MVALVTCNACLHTDTVIHGMGMVVCELRTSKIGKVVVQFGKVTHPVAMCETVDRSHEIIVRVVLAYIIHDRISLPHAAYLYKSVGYELKEFRICTLAAAYHTAVCDEHTLLGDRHAMLTQETEQVVTALRVWIQRAPHPEVVNGFERIGILERTYDILH